MSTVRCDDFTVTNSEPPLVVPDNLSVPQFLHQRLISLQDEDRDRKLFIDQETGRSLSAIQLVDHAHRIATGILRRVPELSPHDVVLFHAVNSLELITSQLAVIFLGLTYSPVTMNCKSYEVGRQIDDLTSDRTSSGGALIFCSSNYADTVGELIDGQFKNTVKLAVVLDGTWPGLTSLDDLMTTSDIDDAKPLEVIPHFPVTDTTRELYIVIYTSGTTGLPKGAAHSHNGFLNAVLNVAVGKVRHPLEYAYFPLAHSAGQMIHYGRLTAGVTSIINGHQTPETLVEAIQNFRLPSVSLDPGFGQFIVGHPDMVTRYDLSSWREVTTGGCHFPESIARSLTALLGLEVLEGYGTTEVGWISERQPGTGYRPGNVGIPARGISIRIMDLTTGKPIPIDEQSDQNQGEIQIQTSGQILGYLNRPEATREAFTAGWYRTGDIGHLTPSGEIVINDRRKEMIKFMSYAVYPAEVEQVLSSHPAVLESVVVPVPHPVYNQLPRAYVALRPGLIGSVSVSEETLLEFVADRLADQKHLRGGIVFLDDGERIPRVSIGKPDRQYFKKLAKLEGNN